MLYGIALQLYGIVLYKLVLLSQQPFLCSVIVILLPHTLSLFLMHLVYTDIILVTLCRKVLAYRNTLESIPGLSNEC